MTAFQIFAAILGSASIAYAAVELIVILDTPVGRGGKRR